MNEEIFSGEKCSLLLELSHAFSPLLTPEDLLPTIMAHTKEVLRAESCAVLLLDEERQELFFAVTTDLSPIIEERFREIRFPANRGMRGGYFSRARRRMSRTSRETRGGMRQWTGGLGFTRERSCTPRCAPGAGSLEWLGAQ